jgi:hypothetical protein
MLSVERHGDNCKAYATAMPLLDSALRGNSTAELSSEPTHRVRLLDTLFELECCELRVKRLTANA